jgi:hypothetical protein
MVTHTEVNHGVQWTIERCTVGTDCPAAAASQEQAARRTASGGSPQVFRRDSVDPVDRRAVESVAPHVREFEHVLAAAAAVGRGRYAAGAVARLPGGLERR